MEPHHGRAHRLKVRDRHFYQLYTFQKWLEEPSQSAQTTYVDPTQAFHRSYLTGFFNTTNYNMIGPAAPYSPNHPNFASLTWTSYNNQINKLPLYLQTHFSMGYNHDAYGLQDYNGVLYTTIWNQLVDFTMSVPNVKIGDRNQPYKLVYLNASMDWSRQWYSVPHHVNTQNTAISLSRHGSIRQQLRSVHHPEHERSVLAGRI